MLVCRYFKYEYNELTVGRSMSRIFPRCKKNNKYISFAYGFKCIVFFFKAYDNILFIAYSKNFFRGLSRKNQQRDCHCTLKTTMKTSKILSHSKVKSPNRKYKLLKTFDALPHYYEKSFLKENSYR